MQSGGKMIFPVVSTPMAALVDVHGYGGGHSRGHNDSQLTGSLSFSVKHPMFWSKNEVQDWLSWCISTYSLSNVKREKFEMNGKGLCMLTKDNFIERVPNLGDLLFNTLKTIALKASTPPPPNTTDNKGFQEINESPVSTKPPNPPVDMYQVKVQPFHRPFVIPNQCQETFVNVEINYDDKPLDLSSKGQSFPKNNLMMGSKLLPPLSPQNFIPFNPWGVHPQSFQPNPSFGPMGPFQPRFYPPHPYRFPIRKRKPRSKPPLQEKEVTSIAAPPAELAEKQIAQQLTSQAISPSEQYQMESKQNPEASEKNVFAGHQWHDPCNFNPTQEKLTEHKVEKKYSAGNLSLHSSIHNIQPKYEKMTTENSPIPVTPQENGHLYHYYLKMSPQSDQSQDEVRMEEEESRLVIDCSQNTDDNNNKKKAESPVLPLTLENDDISEKQESEGSTFSDRESVGPESPPPVPDTPTNDSKQRQEEEKKNGKTSPESKKDGIEDRILWEFIYKLLQRPGNEDMIQWEKKEERIFRIKKPQKLADQWGKQKNRTNMTYEKLSRALRYYYSMNIISRVEGKKLIYRFNRPPEGIVKNKRGAKPLIQNLNNPIKPTSMSQEVPINPRSPIIKPCTVQLQRQPIVGIIQATENCEEDSPVNLSQNQARPDGTATAYTNLPTVLTNGHTSPIPTTVPLSPGLALPGQPSFQMIPSANIVTSSMVNGSSVFTVAQASKPRHRPILPKPPSPPQVDVGHTTSDVENSSEHSD